MLRTDGLLRNARLFRAAFLRVKEEEALENIKEAITAWLWAEDQKAVSALPEKVVQQQIVVAV